MSILYVADYLSGGGCGELANAQCAALKLIGQDCSYCNWWQARPAFDAFTFSKSRLDIWSSSLRSEMVRFTNQRDKYDWAAAGWSTCVGLAIPVRWPSALWIPLATSLSHLTGVSGHVYLSSQ